MDRAAQENESLEQYSRRNCLLFHGLKEEENENTNNLIIKFIDEKLGLSIDEHDLDRSHRLGYRHSSASAQTTKPRPIIVKFIRHDIKEKIFGTKKRLAGKPFLITESLTATRIRCIKKLQLLKRKNEICSYWTNDGSIYYMENALSKKVKVVSLLEYMV